MQVLIIGARGQLGSDLMESFSDCQITPYTSEDLDITDEASVQQQIAFTAPDLVINAAAATRSSTGTFISSAKSLRTS